jgi:16S rRNA (guanine1207-N2)-methyltransferase
MQSSIATPTRLDFAGQSLRLRRYPLRRDQLLRAWDAADEYLLSTILASTEVPAREILVVNDAFGALSLGLRQLPELAASRVTVMSDSVIAHQALALNAADNVIDPESLSLYSSLALSKQPLHTTYDLVLIKIPKSLAQLEDNLRRIRPRLSDKARVIGAGMTKNVHNSTLALFEQTIGATRSSRAHKKARLIFAAPQASTAQIAPADPAYFAISADSTGTGTPLVLASYPGVFCHGSLDFGTRFMLQTMQIPAPAGSSDTLNILDLGCGTGALGLSAAQRLRENAPARAVVVTFIDESFAAIASVNASLERVPAAPGHHYRTLATHCPEGIENNSQDLILNNPPFHDAGARTASIALEMFRESKRVLKKGGQLQVVANRHLGYQRRLRDLFGGCETLGANSKFVVLRASK